MNTTRYFIYVRKSTEGEERQARSIGDQLAEIREIVRREGLEIVDKFEESQSAMTKGRPQFNEMLDRIETGEADCIIAWHPDRLARNAFDGGRIIDLIDQGKLKDLRFCSFWFEPTPQGKLMLNLAFGQSKYSSDSLSVNIRRGQKQKTLDGVWSWKAPIGYLNEPKARTIVPDPERAPLVKKAFELYATGTYTLIRLRETMNAAGLRGHRGQLLTLSRYQYFLKNPFYFGVFNLNGELHEASHEPLITKDLYDAVQMAMQRRSKPNNVRLKSYVYRGLFRCGECGCIITMETQKGHNYLRCTKRVKTDCSQPYAREESVTNQIAAVLTKSSLPDHWGDWMLERLSVEEARGALASNEAQAKMNKEIEGIDRKLDRLTAAYLDAGAFSPAEFRSRKADLLVKKRKCIDDSSFLAESNKSRFEPVSRFINGSKQAKYITRTASPKILRSELEKIGSNLILNDRQIQWEPRGAWKFVVNQGRFAHDTAAHFSCAENSVAEIEKSSGKWSHGESKVLHRYFYSQKRRK